jgi:hypothetical protein
VGKVGAFHIVPRKKPVFSIELAHRVRNIGKQLKPVSERLNR